MKINNAILTRAAIVARDAAIVARQKTRTTDAVRTTDPAHSQLSWNRGRFRDTILSAEPAAHNPAMRGRTWEGNLRTELGALSVADRKAALDAMRRVVRDYDNGMSNGTMGAGAAGSYVTMGDEPFIGSGADPQAVNDANRAYWDKANKHVTRDALPPRDACQAAIQDMQRAADEYWTAATAHQHAPAKEWGKG